MSNLAIQAEGISKQYRLGARERYRTLRDAVTDALRHPFRRNQESGTQANSFWALKDVSFEVKHGEVIGIIGRNGAGKSTLLKILSRITEPTSGTVKILGRVASLLEVGTGFHPELTGRDNIYLNGAILGMKKAEIRRKFDEIVAFAEVEKFIDTPVKHYSSGMYVRLAFAVAAHLEPEILVVDEVLAVGDAEFQKKCLGKMENVARQGRTILLVSHNMASITGLCSSAILMSKGQVVFSGASEKAVELYMGAFGGDACWTATAPEATKAEPLSIRSIQLLGNDGRVKGKFETGQDLDFRITCKFSQGISSVLFVVIIKTITGTPIFHISQYLSGEILESGKEVEISCLLPDCPLFPGRYIASLWVGRNAHQELINVTDALSFAIEQGRLSGIDFDLGWRHGLVHCQSEWSITESTCALAVE